MTAIKTSHLFELQKNHQFQGLSNDCGPFCTAIIINTLTGANETGHDLGIKMARVSRTGILPVVRRIPNWATFPWGIVDVFNSRHIDSGWHLLSSIPDLIDCLFRNKIVITITGNWKPLWAHYMILGTIDTQAGLGFVNPASPSSELFWLSEQRFSRQWKNMGNNFISVSV